MFSPEIDAFVPHSLRILNFTSRDDRQPQAFTLENTQEVLRARNVEKGIMLPVGYADQDHANRACTLFQSTLTKSLANPELVAGSHVDALSSSTGEALWLPFIRIQTDPNMLRGIEQLFNELNFIAGSEDRLRELDYSKFADGRIHTNMNGKLTNALFSGPNLLNVGSAPGVNWVVTVNGDVGSYSID